MPDGALETEVRPGDHEWLERAAALAPRGWGRVHPNPMVGCVLVKDGEPIASGWHAEFGAEHAEVATLARAGPAASGATVYVSLEPCDRVGKTPACSLALIEAGVARVVFGGLDPEAPGSGARRLREAGVEVVGPLFSRERARADNPAFFHRFERPLPYVALKMGVSADGRISAGRGVRTQITGPESMAEVHRLRAGFEAILVGSETVAVDDPQLTVRGEVEPRVPPTRVVWDSRGRSAPGARLFESVHEAPVVVMTAEGADESWVNGLQAVGADVARLVGGAGGIDAVAGLDALERRGVGSVFCEGGAQLAGSLLSADLVRRFYCFRSPASIGGDGVPAFTDPGHAAAWARALEGREAPPGWTLIEGPTRFGADELTVWDRLG